MTKVKPTTKEQLIHYLLSHISLGTYDRRFLTNLETNFLAKKKSVTTNQSDLLNKIIERYARQLSKQELNYTNLQNLPWTHEPVQSSKEFTTAHAMLEDNKILIRTPYKITFIKELKSIRGALWDKDTKTWYVNYNEPNLKHIIDLMVHNYKSVDFCDKIKEILNTLELYESAKVWDPTLVLVQDRLIIAGINQQILDAIQDIELEYTPKCFSKLVSLGINISEDLIKDEYFDFASSRNYVIEKTNLNKIADYLAHIDCPNVYLSLPSFTQANDVILSFNRYATDKGINVLNIHNRKFNEIKNDDYVFLHTRSSSNGKENFALKSIQIVDSTPIVIK